MKCLVAGSIPPDASPDLKRGFSEACQQIGKILAERGHSVCVSSELPEHADSHVVEGMSKASGTHDVFVFRFGKSALPYQPSRFQNIKFHFRSSDGPFAISRIRAIAESDAVLVIGGGQNTSLVAYCSPALMKPVLAVPCFNGIGATVWEQFKSDYRGRFDESEATRFESGWSGDSAEFVVSSLETLRKRNPYKSSSLRSFLALGGFLILLVCWFGLFFAKLDAQQYYDYRTYGLVVIAAILGVGLRSTIRFLGGDRSSLSVEAALNETLAAVLVAFGFVLLYVAGALVITGDYVLLLKRADFVRVSATLSLLSFGSAVLLERAVLMLKRKLKETLFS